MNITIVIFINDTKSKKCFILLSMISFLCIRQVYKKTHSTAVHIPDDFITYILALIPRDFSTAFRLKSNLCEKLNNYSFSNNIRKLISCFFPEDSAGLLFFLIYTADISYAVTYSIVDHMLIIHR